MASVENSRRGFAVALLLLAACRPIPLQPYSLQTPPLVLVPAGAAGVVDQRGRFREIFCALTAERGAQLPDHRSCEEALARLELEPPPSGVAVDPSPSPLTFVAVLGLGGDCLQSFLEPDTTMAEHLAARDVSLRQIRVGGLSSSSANAAAIRRDIMERPDLQDTDGLVLIGYSKGIVDILEALVAYPEIRSRVRGVVSIAGAIGGSPLANRAPPWIVRIFQLVPGAECEAGDLGAVESLKPAPRARWLAQHALPDGMEYYSVVSLPTPDRVSRALESSYDELSLIDPRNDSQLLFFDQIVPGSRLLAFVNADHLAIALPIARSHPWLAELGLDKNDFPREILLEAIARHVTEDLQHAPARPTGSESGESGPAIEGPRARREPTRTAHEPGALEQKLTAEGHDRRATRATRRERKRRCEQGCSWSRVPSSSQPARAERRTSPIHTPTTSSRGSTTAP